jgi:outer membrane protein assembly factor BamB
MKRISLAFLILCVCFISASWAQTITCPPSVNWTEFLTTDMARYNPCEMVLSVDNVGSLQLKWTAKTFTDRVDSSPAVVNGVVYIGSSNKKLYALKASTGGVLGHVYTAAAVFSSPAVANGVVYVGSTDGGVYAWNASTGILLWSYQTGGGWVMRSSPAVANGVVYIGSGDGNVYALDATTGSKL